MSHNSFGKYHCIPKTPSRASTINPLMTSKGQKYSLYEDVIMLRRISPCSGSYVWMTFKNIDMRYFMVSKKMKSLYVRAGIEKSDLRDHVL